MEYLYLTFQKNGNLEIVCKNESIWSTETITDNVDFMYLKKRVMENYFSMERMKLMYSKLLLHMQLLSQRNLYRKRMVI